MIDIHVYIYCVYNIYCIYYIYCIYCLYIAYYLPEAELTKQSSHLANACAAFAQKFENDPARADPGRAQRKLPAEATLAMAAIIESIQPNALKGASLDKVKMEVTPATFAVAKQRVTSSAEPGHLSSFRIGYSGTRQVTLACTESVLNFIRSSDQCQGPTQSTVTAQRAYEWLKTATSDGIKAFKSHAGENSVQYGSVGVGDILYTPAGWFFYEQVGGSDYVGARGAFLISFDMKRLDSLCRYFLAVGKPNEILSRALDAIAASED